MKHLPFRSIICLFVLFLPSTLFSTEALFKNYSVSDGLVTKSVTGIIQDKEGFIWIATANGVSRFDGYEFRNFASLGQEQTALKGTFVFDIAEGKNGKIWISTDAGLECYDKASEAFYLSIKGNMFKKKAEILDDGTIWMTDSASDFCVYSEIYSQMQKRRLNLPFEQKEQVVIYNFIANNDAIWIACNKGIASYNYQTGSFRWIEKSGHIGCSKIHVADSNRLIFTFPDEGICTVNTHDLQISWIDKKLIERQTGKTTSLFDALADNGNELCVAVSSGLLSIKDSSVAYYSSSSDDFLLDGNSFTSLCKDRNGNIWAGTIEHGLFFKRKASKGVKFSTKLHKDDSKKTSISNFQLYQNNQLLYDDSKTVYLCPDYTALKEGCAKKILEGEYIWSASLDSRYGIIYKSDTAFIYDSESESLTRSHTIPMPACACKDSNGIIWTGTWMGDLLGYDPISQKHIEVEIEPGDNKQIVIFTIICAADGSLWLGTFGKGLVHIANQTDDSPIVTFYNKQAHGDFFLNADMILCLHIDPNQNLWAGTNGNGIATIDRSNKNLKVFTINDGLKSNIIESITSDKQGNIWIATNVVSKYDIHQQAFTHYLQPEKNKESFIVKAASKTKKGHLLFANTKGIYAIDPLLVENAGMAPVPILTNFKIRGIITHVGDTIEGAVPYKNSISFSDKITLPYRLNSFSIVFASIEYSDMNMIDYQYKLEGIDKSWIPADANNRTANYAGIQPGNYTFQVRASCGPENWSKSKDLKICITPPWWKTVWFKIVSSLLIVALVAHRIMKNRKQKRMLEKKVKQRTDSLSKANTLLQESYQVLEMKNDQLEEALETKDRLIQVIAHDFKNPLGAISSNLSLLENKFQQLDTAKISEMLNSATHASSLLQQQMSSVLEWALSEESEITYKPTEINIEILINDALALVKKNAERKNIAISIRLEYQSTAFVDSRMISTVIRNLLINAIKFTPENGTVAIAAQEYETGIEVSVIDSGTGISSEHIELILCTENPFATADTENAISSGVGLRLSKLFVEKNNGKLFARSQENRGSVFSFTVPKGKTKATKPVAKRTETATGLKQTPFIIEADTSVTILVIDDNKQILQLLKQLFGDYYNVLTASDAQSGIQMASNLLPSLIISDIAMPHTSGTALCQALKNDLMTAKIPIILITGDKKLMTESYASGADDFIVKPFSEEELLLKAHSLLENRKRVIKQLDKKTENNGFILPESFDDAIVSKLLEYVNKHFCEPEIDIQTIGQNVGLGRTQLWFKFKSATGKTVNEYIRGLRLAKAKEMLRSDKYKISEVCYEVGYTNPQYFSKSFTKHVGISPREYQNKEHL